MMMVLFPQISLSSPDQRGRWHSHRCWWWLIRASLCPIAVNILAKIEQMVLHLEMHKMRIAEQFSIFPWIFLLLKGTYKLDETVN
jgi:hypothetical protein